MIITAIGVFFWLLTFAAVYRLLRIGRATTRFQWLGLVILLCFAVLLLFRPHEDIFGGEDPGSYINSGISYNRQKQLFYVDELLSKVPPKIRPYFYYGHAGYGATKDACLWIRNAGLAMVGPHFQPAYPLLIAAANRISPNSWALFVVPLFTILTALALRALASQTIPYRWAGLIVFILYVFNPLIIWHGRCARPEIIAAFMFFAGGALTLQAWQSRPWKNMPDILLGAACLGAAPFFHITAWALVIPVVLAVVIIILFKERNDFLPYLIIIGLMMYAFYVQTTSITDYYTVKRFLDLIFLRPGIIAAGFILLMAAAFIIKYLRHSRFKPEPSPAAPASSLLSLSFGLVLIAFLMSLFFFRQIYGDFPVLGRPIKHYLYLTDFRVVVNMLSVPVMLLILAGLIAWLTGRAEKRDYRIILALVLLPAVMLTGNIHDFMMTRYLMVAFIPVSALFLTALIAFVLPARSGLWGALFLSAIICVLAVNKRSHLITTTEHKGFCRFLRPYAEVIKTNKGMLLCEYSRIAAPLEHFFGVPTLGLDNERQTDYEPMEKAWADIMKSEPERAAYFMTPYQAPRSAYFDFEPIFNNSFQDCRLAQARQSLPVKVGKSELTLQLYRLKLKQPQPQIQKPVRPPTIIKPDAGNMGWRHFANVRNEPFSNQGAELKPDPSNLSALPTELRQRAELFMLIPQQPTIQARWARAHSKVLLPAARRQSSLLMIYLKAPDPDGSNSISLQLVWGKEKLGEARKINSGQWQWQIWQLSPLPAGLDNNVEWLTLETYPAWNPGLPNFPNDLGILISQIVSLPINK
ncbi:MAG: hypothetical protein Q7J98_10985 [Kiritimatiellia bacterium]|nr:hypothetical protein [Kiritimatiellia bacterium]